MKNLIFILFTFFTLLSYSQIDNGEIGPNFEGQDINGVTHNLYD